MERIEVIKMTEQISKRYFTDFSDTMFKAYEWCVKNDVPCECENNPDREFYTITLISDHQTLDEFEKFMSIR